jgi:NitT/TauT family transport system substrate-binding protein
MEHLTMTHGLALSNLPVFIAQEYGLYRKNGLEVQLLRPMGAADVVNFLRRGEAEMASCAFTSLMPLYEESQSIRIVAGAGVLGLFVLAQPDIGDWDDLRGRRAATLPMDPLEILLYESLVTRGVPYDSLARDYLSSPQELTRAFAEHEADVVTHVEPFAGQLVRNYGAKILTDGTDIWGPRYPDCVIAARVELLRERPRVVKAVLRALLQAQAAIERDLESACRAVMGRYYAASEHDLLQAAASMPPGVDIRDQREVILARGNAMAALGYVTRPADERFVDFSLLDELIQEERTLWETLRVRAPKQDGSAELPGG